MATDADHIDPAPALGPVAHRRLSEWAEDEAIASCGAESRRLNAEIHKLRTDSRKKAPAAEQLAELRTRVRQLADNLADMGKAGTQAALFAGQDLTAEERAALTAVAPVLAHLAWRVRDLLSPPSPQVATPTASNG